MVVCNVGKALDVGDEVVVVVAIMAKAMIAINGSKSRFGSVGEVMVIIVGKSVVFIIGKTMVVVGIIDKIVVIVVSPLVRSWLVFW